MKTDLSLGSIKTSARDFGRKLLAYKAFVFFIVLAVVYGFIIWRINTLSNVEPSQSDVSQSSQTTAQPHIDPTVVQKIQNLQDNSVNVQSLFDQARQNPFQE
jgi:hypothetical protein